MTMRSIILATIAAALSASLALAVPLRFENPEGPDRIAWENFFVDITKPASEQPGDLLFSVRNAVNFTKDKAITIMFSISPTGSVRLLGESSLLTPMEFGELIGPGGLTPNMAGGGLFTTTIAPGGDLSTEFRFPLGRWHIGASISSPFGSEERHFGWYFFDFFEGPDGIPDVDLLAWGFETEPGVPVAAGAPAPGAAGAFVIAGAAFCLRRRR